MKILKATIIFLSLFLIGNSQAANETWEFQVDQGIQVAKVRNDSGSVAGVLCDVGNDGCLTYLSIIADCDDGATYPMIINSTGGAVPLVATCTTVKKSKYFVFDEFDSVILAFTSGAEFGFAMPMASGQFRVVRFSYIGASKAIAKAREKGASRTTKNSLSDQSL